MKNTMNRGYSYRIPLVILLMMMIQSLLAQEIIPPSCIAGNRLTREFIQEDMIYPAKDLEAGIEGNVILSFIVEADGSVNDLFVMQKVSPGIDQEAIRVFNKILWFPATNLGNPIPYRHTFEMKFRIKKYQKLIKQRGYEYFAHPYEPVDTSYQIYYRKELDQLPKPVFSILDNNFQTFLSNNLTYPEAAFKQNISGTVILKFVIETNGRISNIMADKTVGGGCTEEAIRVARLIKWIPGILEGYAVRTYMPLEITFDIAKRSVGGAIPSPGQLQ